MLDRIQRVGQEFGATTGRVRQCNWLNLSFLKRSVLMNSVNKLVINKLDVLRETETWNVTNTDSSGKNFYEFFSKEIDFKDRIIQEFDSIQTPFEIIFSQSPEQI